MSKATLFGPLIGTQWGPLEKKRIPVFGNTMPEMLVHHITVREVSIHIPSRYNMCPLDELCIPGFSEQGQRLQRELMNIMDC
jgi:hypothetical protein